MCTRSWWMLLLFCYLIAVVACAPTTRNDEITVAGALDADDQPGRDEEQEEISGSLLAEVSGIMNPDAAAFAEQEGLSLEEAGRRLAHQETIGEIQPLLMAELPDSFAGLWVEHQPSYRIVVALTEGGLETVLPYIEDEDWASFVEVRLADYTLEELTQDQVTASQAAREIKVSVTTAVDIVNNQVEVTVGNPTLFQADLEKAGIVLPKSVTVLAVDPAGEPPATNRGVLLEAMTPDGRTIYLPKQPPTNESMAALMEGTLLEVNGCLRISDENYADGFMVIWPQEADIRVAGSRIEVINETGQAVARVGERLRAGGGATESSASISGIDQLIPGMPVKGCPGPYWVAGELETLVEQSVPDIYFEPFSSGGRTLAWFVSQSRPSPESETLSGELLLDDDGCLRIGNYLIIWPPDVYLREEPLRLVDSDLEDIVPVGETIQVTGGEKSSDDYRYFDNKVHCSGPYWGVNTISDRP